jgi:GNAT superfamily N-acetyltransferase
VASLLARAFRDNPLNVAVIGGTAERRLRVNLHGMRALLPTAARWARVAAADRSGRMLGGVTRRWAAVFRALDALHPREPHWYLATLGVDPDAQGEGIGGALASSLLEWADRDALPAYLETDRPENVSFYERLGFRVEQEVEVLGAPIWRMLRPAASA